LARVRGEREEALRRVAIDVRAQGRPLRVYCYLQADLDFEAFRPVKLLVVGQQLRLAKGHVSYALRVLILTGHLEAGPTQDRVNTFRLSQAVGGGRGEEGSMGGNQKSA
jgi:hypothetical protein